jgi:hypothetical protein
MLQERVIFFFTDKKKIQNKLKMQSKKNKNDVKPIVVFVYS